MEPLGQILKDLRAMSLISLIFGPPKAESLIRMEGTPGYCKTTDLEEKSGLCVGVVQIYHPGIIWRPLKDVN